MAFRQPLILVRKVSPPLGFGTAHKQRLLTTELSVTPIAVFVGHAADSWSPAPDLMVMEF